MNIIILGAGQVGASVAENLASEANDITLVDTNTLLLNELSDRLDIQTIVGHASHPDVLKQAGIGDADMLSPTVMKPTSSPARLPSVCFVRRPRSRVSGPRNT